MPPHFVRRFFALDGYRRRHRQRISRASRATADSRLHARRPALAPRRPVPRRLGHDGRRRARSARHVLLRRGRRRRLEDRRRRRDLAAALRTAGSGVGRRARGRAVGSEDALRRHRPARAALRHRRRRRRLQSTDGGATWQHVGLRDDAPHRRDPVDPRDAEHRARRRARPRLRPEPRARRLPHRPTAARPGSKTLFVDDETGAVDLAADPRTRIVFAAIWQARYYLAHYFTPIEGDGQRRSTSRPTAARPGSASAATGWPAGKLGRIGLAAAHRGRRDARLRRSIDAEDARRPLPLRRRRRALAARQRRRAGQHWLLQPPHRRTRRPDTRLHHRPVDPPLDRRRQDAARSSRARPAATTTTTSGSTRRTAEPHDHRERPGHGRHRQRRRELERLVQPADRPVLPPRRRQPLPVPDLQRPAGHRHGGHRQPQRLRRAHRSATGIRSAATSATTTFPTRDDPDIVFGSGLGGALSRWDARTGEVQNISPWPVVELRRAADRRSSTATPGSRRSRSPRTRRTRSTRARRCCSARPTRAQHWDDDQPRPDRRKRDGAKDCDGDVRSPNATRAAATA